MKLTGTLAAVAALVLSGSAQEEKDAEFRAAMRENILMRIEESDSVATICIYEQEWIPPTKEESKGEVVHRAVITNVHKGNLAVGTQLEFSYLIEDPPKLFSHFRATVPGRLEYFFFSHEGMQRTNDKIVLDIGTHWSCDRLKGIYAELFQEELARDPALQTKSETATGQPATESKLDSDTSDKPQPESEVRSRR
jgi:hypothetical protein